MGIESFQTDSNSNTKEEQSTISESEKRFWNLVAKYRRGVRPEMMEFIEGTARNSTEIGEEVGITTNAAANYLREAKDEGLVEVIDDSVDMYKMYRLTEKGKMVLKEL